MKRLVLSVLVMLAGTFTYANTAPQKQREEQIQKELRVVVDKVAQLMTRAGNGVDASEVLADAILQCLYEPIKPELMALLVKACFIESVTDSLAFTILDTIENTAASLGFTVCDKISTLEENVGFTVCDKAQSFQDGVAYVICNDSTFLADNIGFTVCDKINAISDPLKFTVVDQITNLAASIGFTVCDKLESLVITGLDSIAFTICDKVENMGASLGFTICDKADPIFEDLSSIMDKACSINSLLDFFVASDDEIDPLKFTVCDKAETICSKIDQIFNCPPTAINQKDFDDNGGSISLPADVPSQSKNYCLAENITAASIDLVGDDVTLDLNNRAIALTSNLDVFGDRCIVKNGTITAVGAGSTVFVNSDKVQILNCVITGGSGLDGVRLSGADGTRIVGCCIEGGSSVPGILSLGDVSNTRVIDCIIRGGTGEPGVVTAGSSECYQNCKIFTGDGPNQVNAVTVSGGSHTAFLDCFIIGCSVSGSGFHIESGARSTVVLGNTLAHHDTPGGRAVEDLNAIESSIDGASVVFDNFAYDIGDTTVRYNLHNEGMEGGINVNTPPENLDNVFVP